MGAHGRRPRCGAHDHTIFKTLSSLGFEGKWWNGSQLYAKHDLVPKPIKVLRLGYLQDYPEIWGDESLLVFTSGHVAAFHNGQLHDHGELNRQLIKRICTITRSCV